MPRQGKGNIIEDRGGNQHLFEITDGISQPRTPGLIELGKDVIEDKHRITGARFPPQHGGRRQLQR